MAHRGLQNTNIHKNRQVMKKLLLFLAAMITSAAMLQGCEETRIKENRLPEEAQTFIHQYFPGVNITFAEREKDDGYKHYNVKLADGTEIEFDASGNWTSIDCEFANLPAGVLPETITTYIENNYPGSKAYKADKEFGGYEVGITGGLELIFNTAGEFVRESR